MKLAKLVLCLLLCAVQHAYAQSLDSILQSSGVPQFGSTNPILEYEKKLDPSGSNITVIGADDILARGYDNLDELLSSIPGVFITHDRISTQIGIRGMSPTEENNQRILILLDNVPINNPLSGLAPSGYELKGIAMEDIAEVIVIRSPMSVLYGNGAMVGVIKINTKISRSKVRLNFDLGSYGELDGGFAIDQTFGKTTVSVSGRIASITGQELYFPEFFGSVPHGDEMEYSGYQLRLRHGRFALNSSFTRRSGRIATAPDSSYPLDDRGNYFERQLFADLAYSGPVGSRQSNYAHAFVNYHLNERELFYEQGDTIREDRLEEGLHTGLEYQHLFQLSDLFELMTGTEFWYVPDASFTSSGSIGSNTTQSSSYWTYGLFAHGTVRLNDQFGINGGLRIDLNSRTDPQLMPQIAVSFQPVDASVIRLGYSRGYRLPSLLETEISQFDSPNIDADLLPEIANGVELGWKQQLSPTLQLNLGFYFQQLDRLINQDPNLFQYVNEDVSDFSGLDGGFLIELASGVQTYVNYNFPFNTADAVNLPSPLCKFGLTLPFLRHFSFFAEGQYEGSRATIDDRQAQSFFLLNTNLLIRPRIEEPAKALQWLNQSSIALRVHNALDQFYQHPAGRSILPNFVAQNGRTWQAQLTLQF